MEETTGDAMIRATAKKLGYHFDPKVMDEQPKEYAYLAECPVCNTIQLGCDTAGAKTEYYCRACDDNGDAHVEVFWLNHLNDGQVLLKISVQRMFSRMEDLEITDEGNT